jgi:alpha-amylase
MADFRSDAWKRQRVISPIGTDIPFPFIGGRGMFFSETMTKRTFLPLLIFFLLTSCTTPKVDSTPQPTPPPKPWWDHAVFYEIFVRSSYDSDGNGIGDFNGITQKLDYLSEMGITAVWLMPIFPSPSYHGYDVTDYYAVNPQYGSMDDFKTLVQEAHKRNIHVIIDLVINHTSDKHPWFKAAKDPKSPYRNWYLWSQTDPKYVGPWGERVWHPSPSGYYYGIFESFMPDLNYSNPAVTAEMKKISAFWLKDVGVDGFRLDAAKHLVEDGLKQENTKATHLWYQNEFYPAYKTINPEAMTVGELFGDGFNTVGEYIKNKQFDLAFNFQLAGSFIEAANTGKVGYLSDTIVTSETAIPNHRYATFLTNHDQERTMSQLGGDVNKAKLAAFLLLTSPGVPFIYYGEEIGMSGRKPDENIRMPMQWSSAANAGFTLGRPWRALAWDYPRINVAAQTGTPGSLLEHYRTLIHLRDKYPTLQTGNIVMLKSNKPALYTAMRVDKDGIFLILANLSDAPIDEYNVPIEAAGLAQPAYSVETVFGLDQADVQDVQSEALSTFKPFNRLAPYAMYVLKINPK